MTYNAKDPLVVLGSSGPEHLLEDLRGLGKTKSLSFTKSGANKGNGAIVNVVNIHDIHNGDADSSEIDRLAELGVSPERIDDWGGSIVARTGNTEECKIANLAFAKNPQACLVHGNTIVADNAPVQVHSKLEIYDPADLSSLVVPNGVALTPQKIWSVIASHLVPEWSQQASELSGHGYWDLVPIWRDGYYTRKSYVNTSTNGDMQQSDFANIPLGCPGSQYIKGYPQAYGSWFSQAVRDSITDFLVAQHGIVASDVTFMSEDSLAKPFAEFGGAMEPGFTWIPVAGELALSSQTRNYNKINSDGVLSSDSKELRDWGSCKLWYMRIPELSDGLMCLVPTILAHGCSYSNQGFQPSGGVPCKAYWCVDSALSDVEKGLVHDDNEVFSAKHASLLAFACHQGSLHGNAYDAFHALFAEFESIFPFGAPATITPLNGFINDSANANKLTFTADVGGWHSDTPFVFRSPKYEERDATDATGAGEELIARTTLLNCTYQLNTDSLVFSQGYLDQFDWSSRSPTTAELFGGSDLHLMYKRRGGFNSLESFTGYCFYSTKLLNYGVAVGDLTITSGSFQPEVSMELDRFEMDASVSALRIWLNTIRQNLEDDGKDTTKVDEALNELLVHGSSRVKACWYPDVIYEGAELYKGLSIYQTCENAYAKSGDDSIRFLNQKHHDEDGRPVTWKTVSNRVENLKEDSKTVFLYIHAPLITQELDDPFSSLSESDKASFFPGAVNLEPLGNERIFQRAIINQNVGGNSAAKYILVDDDELYDAFQLGGNKDLIIYDNASGTYDNVGDGSGLADDSYIHAIVRNEYGHDTWLDVLAEYDDIESIKSTLDLDDSDTDFNPSAIFDGRAPDLQALKSNNDLFVRGLYSLKGFNLDSIEGFVKTVIGLGAI